MKELENTKPDTQQEIKAQAKQEFKYIGKIVLRKGCRLYGWNYVTDTLAEVILTKDLKITKFGKAEVKQKATHAADTLYIQAINLANARRKANNLKKLL